MRKTSRARKQGLGIIEQLEDRRLLSASLDGDTLRILCGAAQDSVAITLSGDQLLVDVNGQRSTFAQAAVAKIYWEGGDGADRFELQRDLAIPVEAWGGRGPDVILTGAGNDTVTAGMGADLILTGDGKDLIRAGLGNDRVLAGGKNDSIYGGEGDDLLNSGAGVDLVLDFSGTNAIDSGSASTFQPMSKLDYQPLAYLPTVTGYDPNQIRKAYNLGVNETQAEYWQRGCGQTIYIVNAFTGGDIYNDLVTYSSEFDLPLPTDDSLRVVYEGGRSPAIDSAWAGEINLDVQWAHAIAPAANIVLVLADSNLEPDLYRATRLAAQMASDGGGGVVSMSWGTSGGLNPAIPWEALFSTHATVSFVAASGDGSILSFPSAAPTVTSVGGTNLLLDREGYRTSEESAWVEGGSGVALAYTRPTFQRGLGVIDAVTGDPTLGRGVPDVSYNADPATPFAIYLTTPSGGNRGWFAVGGTSAGAPQWAALVAIINQKREDLGAGPIGSSLNGSLYDMYNMGVGTDNNTAPFNDIIAGFSVGQIVDAEGGTTPQVFNTYIGYDLATGLGTPNGDNLIYWMSNIDPFYFQDDFKFEARMVMPPITANPDFAAALGQYRAGYGYIAGDDLLQLRFVTTKFDLWNDPTGLARGDTYFNLDADFPSSQYVYLYRTGRGQDSGNIYGIGDALIINTDPAYTDVDSVAFKLKFEGTWWRSADGGVDFDIKFYAVDPVTWEKIHVDNGNLWDVDARLVPYYEGEIKG